MSCGADVKRPGIVSLGDCSPNRNSKVAQCQLTVLKIVVEMIVGRIATVSAKWALMSLGLEIERTIRSCKTIQ